MRGVECIVEVIPVIILYALVLGVYDILPNDAHFTAGGKVPDELQVDCKSIEIDIVMLVVIARVKFAFIVQGIEIKIFRSGQVMPHP